MKNDKLIQEYIKLILEDDGGFDMGGGTGGWGVSFGSDKDLYNVFVKPFSDVFATTAGKTKELSQKALSLGRVAFEAAMTTIFPFLKSDYDQIFAKEKAAIQDIKQEYKDVYDATWTAFKDNDIALAAFLYSPKAILTAATIRNAPIAATKMISVLTGGVMDDFLAKVGKFFKLGNTVKPLSNDTGPGIGESRLREMSDRFDRKREKNSGQYTYSIDQLCQCGHSLGNHTAERSRDPVTGKRIQPCIMGDFGEPCSCECFKPKKKMSEANLREDASKKDIAQVLMQKKILSAIDSNSRIQTMSKKMQESVNAALMEVVKTSQMIDKAQTLEQLEQLLKKKVPAIEKLKQLPEKERLVASQQLMETMRKSAKSFYAKNLEVQLQTAMKAGIPQDHPFVKAYRETITKIKS